MCSPPLSATKHPKLTHTLPPSPPPSTHHRPREPIPAPVQGHQLPAAAGAVHRLQEGVRDRHEIETSSTDSKREGLRLQYAAERLDAVVFGAFGAI